MAAYSMFGFHFLRSCFMLLVLAAAQKDENYEECLVSQPCGYLGDINFPFTTRPRCGLLQIEGCEDPGAVKKIQLTTDPQRYQIDTLFNIASPEYRSIFIHRTEYPDPFASKTLKPYFKIIYNISFFRCTSDPNILNHTMSLYRKCPSYYIYFNFSSEYEHGVPTHLLPFRMPILPFACLLNQFPPINQVSVPTCPSCTFLFSFLEIKVTIPESCKQCYPPQCHFNPGPYPSCAPIPSPAEPKAKKLRQLSLGLSIPSAIAVVALLAVILLYKQRKKPSGLKNQTRSAYSASFIESGAVYFGIPIFSYEELQKATNNFDQARELGEGGFGTVYYGKLADQREVAVKRLFERNYRPVESFINEIQILTRLRHQNLVPLYGCTSRHSRELLLVYEYIPNGTVNSHLHGDQAKPCSLPWLVRMKIAIQTARALAYLHANDIIHRDVKTSNILLDNDFCVKVADFGLSRLFPDNVTHVSTAPQGTPGYVDPDYRLCYQLTTKSDVYSFGVVLVELMSSLKAIDINRSRDDIKLANLAIRKIQKGVFCDLVDPFLGFQTDEKLKRMIVSVAELAFQCLQGDKELRPSMGEVLEVLQGIQSGFDEPGNLEGIVVHGATRASQSYAHPPLSNTVMRPHPRLHQTH